jgi:hypothetical protein
MKINSPDDDRTVRKNPVQSGHACAGTPQPPGQIWSGTRGWAGRSNHRHGWRVRVRATRHDQRRSAAPHQRREELLMIAAAQNATLPHARIRSLASAQNGLDATRYRELAINSQCKELAIES